MWRRHLSVGTILAALLLGMWGQVLAAVSCPHMRQGHACCHARVGHKHEADGTMDDMRMTPAVQSAQCASDKPIEGCDHCMGRSSQSPLTATLREIDRINPGSKLAAPVAAPLSSDLTPPFTAPVPSREHSPPGSSGDRHALISVFRI